MEKSVWLIGGDGWAYDIGFGGLDHVLSLTENVNILVLDTQCYSNTGGQASKATPLGAVTKFGEHGKRKARKDLGVSMMMYGHVYVAQISLGAQLNQTVKAIQEAEAYPGPSLIIAYSPCEEHGYDLALSHDQMRQLTATGFWPLYRFDPRRADEGKIPLALDSRPPSDALAETLLNEQRFRRLTPSSLRWRSSYGKTPPPICRSAMTSSPSWLAKRRNRQAKVNRPVTFVHKKKPEHNVRACRFFYR
ncbi:Pyruvate-flavodoxin oxidoreductase [Klebsiella pneumoniae IS39]|nr:Pyruvate-flavodoxin oxidoreductase [Klebsiella pneumoniae IS39]